VTPGPLPPSTEIRLEIARGGKTEFSGSTTLSALKRDPVQLVDYLFAITLSEWLFAVDGHGYCSTGCVHATARRRDPHHHPADRTLVTP